MLQALATAPILVIGTGTTRDAGKAGRWLTTSIETDHAPDPAMVLAIADKP